QAPLAAAVWHLLLARAWRGAEASEPLPSAILLAPLAAWLDAPTLARLGAGIGDAAYQSPQSSSSSPSDSS
ncbi:MAG TPA: UDP-N-acetylmuramoyl-L-alanine--D-glutamate ligase, partial [Plasticicumulans sp.]|nr:UDP-N-acetylmuramoyl-L-alanine--D-glutamate ligase [Plasticicumulans sp.]